MTQEQAIVFYISQMDIEKISEYLDESGTFLGDPKIKFLSHLKDAFAETKENGNTELVVSPSYCDGCRKEIGAKGYYFAGNNTGQFFNLIITLNEEGKVTELFGCWTFQLFTEAKQFDKTLRFFLNNERPGDELPF